MAQQDAFAALRELKKQETAKVSTVTVYFHRVFAWLILFFCDCPANICICYAFDD
jgi:hypothetical protein